MLFNEHDINRKNEYDYQYPGNNGHDKEDVVTIGHWIGVLIVLGIPIVNIIMYLYWAFSDSSNQNLKNFARASLILGMIGVFFGLLLGGCSAFF